MVNSKSFLVALLLMLSLLGCSHKQLSYEEASKLFHAGMTPSEVEKTFGKPQFQNELGEVVVWDYYPKKQIEAARSGEFVGYTIDFRDGKASKISPTLTVLK